MGTKASDVMQRKVHSVHPRMRLSDLESWLIEQKVRGAPVVDDGRLVGIVSRSDIVRRLVVERTLADSTSAFFLEPFDTEDDPSDGQEQVADAIAARWQKLHVEDVMIHDVIRVDPEEPVERVAQLMLDRRVHRVLVTEGDQLCGLISSLDLVGLVAKGRLGG